MMPARGTPWPGPRFSSSRWYATCAYSAASASATCGVSSVEASSTIVIGESASALNPQFNLLGEVISGQETLELIAAVDTARRPGSREDSLPLETVYIERVTVEVTGS